MNTNRIIYLLLTCAGLLGRDSFAATFTVTNTNDSGSGTLRQAITDANITPGADVIAFNLSGATRTLNVSNALPDLTETVTLDGSTQPGFAGVPLIELNGASAGAGSVDGLRITATNCVVRALVINRFTGDGIEISNTGGALVEGCYLGLNLTGATDLGNTLNGIFITNSPNNVIGGVFSTQRNFISGNNGAGVLIGGVGATNNQLLGNVIGLNVTNNAVANSGSGVRLNASFNYVGGSASGARNVISGNTGSGVELLGATNRNNQVLGNYLGPDLNGTFDRGNTADGVFVNNSGGHVIGSSTPGAGNLISGNGGDGIEINGLNSTNVQVFGNFIGTTADATAGVANSGNGVLITTSSRSNIVGGVSAGAANLIAFNSQDGISVAAANANTNNTFRGNSIHSNGDLGIDLGTSNITGNDNGDADVGANQLQNFPVLTAVTNTPTEVIIVGSLNSRPSTTYTLDFYSNIAFDNSGSGEGQTWLGATNLTTAADSNVAFTVSFPIANLVGRYITATATDPFGNTSEFATNSAAISTVSGLTFTVVNTNDSGAGSLRQAILDANAAVTTGDTIAFAITNLSTTISLASPLPPIVDAVIIDGYTQPGSATNTSATTFNGNVLVRLAGNSAGAGADGLNLVVGNCVVRGLMITGFAGDGLELGGSGNHLVAGNLIGVDAAGTDQGNTGNGILINNSPNNLIGGSSPGARNVISGNNGDGIENTGVAAIGNRVQGNLIGTDQTGSLDVGNTANGVLAGVGGTIIGGANPGEGNLISGNNGSGVELNGTSATNNLVLGNRIGTDASGTLALGNSSGVNITSNSRSNIVGGVSTGQANLIAFNAQDGIAVAAANSNTNNAFRGNSIHSNGDLGIDLATTGITANDSGDADVGANQLQNFPVLTAVTNTPTGIVIVGSLNSRPSTTYAVDFYSNLVPDNSGNGQGQTWFGSTNLTTGTDSNVAFTVSLPVASLQGRYITATATDPFGNTSEFATNVFASSTVPGLVFTVVNTNDSGPGSLRQAILNANAAVTVLDTIAFAITNLTTTIAPTSALPALVDAAIMDGYTQPGAQTNSLANGNNAVIKVQLSGASAPNNVDGLRLESPGCLVRGLSIVGFKSTSGDGIEAVSANNIIEGNFIGLLPDGTNTLGNGGNGVLISSVGNTVGGSSPGSRNVISGNTGDGIELTGVSASNNVVAGNFIGTDAGGVLDRGNANDGVFINGAPGNLIGGPTAASRNVISGNTSEGITIQSTTATNNQVLNNFIGTDPTGTLALGNSSHGVLLTSGVPSGNQIGSPNPGGNLIAFNGQDGVFVAAGTNNAVRANAIYNNGGATAANLGIDLGISGVLANDFPDVATGANLQQNFPELLSATANPTNTEIQGVLRSRPNTVYALDFFSNVARDASGLGEGQKWLGSTNVTTDANGSNVFNVAVPGVVLGRYLTATATDPFGNTSEFGTNILAGSSIPPLTFTVTNVNDSGPGSLRQAILDNNNTVSGTNNLIRFQIPGFGPHTIAPLTQLPVPTERVTIDGYTQPGASANTLTNGNNAVVKIRLDGVNAPFFTDGFALTGIGGNIIRGLSITRFLDAIELGTNGNNRIEGNFLGLDVDGATVAANIANGVYLNNSPANVIGGTTPGARNVISGNNNNGIQIFFPGAVLNRVQGNLIGTDATGTLDRGNISSGLLMDNASTNTIGGTEVGARNVISGNSLHGVYISGNSQGNLIQRNYIGTDVGGAAALGNSSDGVNFSLSGSQGGNLVGGTNAGAGNLIAFNTRDGVSVTSGTNNPIRANIIFANISLGIDLNSDLSVAVNDPGDPDSGANQLQNFPVLAAGTIITPANTTIQGSLNSLPNTTYQLDFFANIFPDLVYPNGEGQQFLGSTTVTTGADSNANFNVTLPVVAIGRHLTATATDPFGNTSEFSPTFAAVSTFPPVTFVVTNTLDSGPGSLRQALLDNNATASATNNLVTFNIPGAGPHVIAPSIALQAISEPVTIDGFTQPGAATNTLASGNNANLRIVLIGTNATFGAPGLGFTSSGNIVRGLNIIDFRDSGIALSTSNNIVEGCVIGLRLDSTVQGNFVYGVSITGAGNRVGGTTAGARNVISGNGGDGVAINGTGATNNVVQGNFIGTDLSGTLDRGNGFSGVNVFASGNVIGGSVAGAGNVIAGNDGSGVNVSLPANDTTIKGNRIGLAVTDAFPSVGNSTAGVTLGSGVSVVGGATVLERNFISGNFGPGIQINTFGTNSLILGNYIGTDGSGTLDRANFGGGIAIASSGTRVGGVAAGEANVIAFNSFAGIYVNSGTNNAFRANRIFNNFNLGIDLGFSGVTSNDVGVADADAGANGLQNFPELTNAVANVGNTVIQGRLDSRPNTVFQLDFFVNQSPDATGFGEGQFWLGTTNVTTDGAGIGQFSAVAAPLSAGARYLTATATDPEGNTSEFSIGIAPSTTIPPEIFTVVNTNDSGPGSLRQALLDVDLLPSTGNDTIRFAIPGSGVRTIAPLTPLPTPRDSVTIDGFTQSGSSSNSLVQGNNAVWVIRLDGTNLPAFAGDALNVTNHNNIIRGLEIVRSPSNGINLNGGSNNLVAGNLIWSNLNAGVFASGGLGNIIGGQTAAARNVISANGGYGVELEINTNSAIQGNFLGTDLTGTTALGGGGGVLMEGGMNNLIGNAGVLRNVISGHNGVGIQLTTSFAAGQNVPLNNRVLGNRIGTDVTGTLAVSNLFGGIILGGAVGTTIGGTNANEPNLIAFNVNDGIQISASPANATNNFILANSIFDNTGLGIDLGFSGVTPNDSGDADSGANRLQNFPVLTNAAITLSNLIAQGTLNSRPSTAYRLDFYANVACDPTGNGEGKHWLGSAAVTTGADSNAAFNVNLPLPPEGLLLTATATDPSGNTSEFSACQQAISLIPSVTFVVTNANDSGPGTLRQAILNNNATFNSGPNRIEFNIAGSGVRSIAPLTPLPQITRPVIIDGFTQPGASPNTATNGNNAIWLIRIDGTSTAGPVNVDGLHFTSSSNTVRGLCIVNFNRDGIELDGGGGSVIEENLLGIDLLSPSGANRFGGGVSAAGDPPNRLDRGINVDDSANNQLLRNYIGFVRRAIFIHGLLALNNYLYANVLGLTPARLPAAITEDGVRINNGAGTQIASGEIFHTAGNAVSVNPFLLLMALELSRFGFVNGMLLDRAIDGPSGNTTSMPQPVISSATTSAGQTTIQGSIFGDPNHVFTLIFYALLTDQFLNIRETTVMTGANGVGTFNEVVPGLPPGTPIVATAANSEGTSEETPRRVVMPAGTPPNSDLGVTKSDSADPVILGSNFVYTITVTNGGPASATNVVIRDFFPSGLFPLSATTTHGELVGGFQPSVHIPVLTNGEVAIITFTTAGFVFTNVFTNTATVSSAMPDPNMLNNTNRETTTIIAPPATVADLVLTKTATTNSIQAGSSFSYLITVTNRGPATAPNVQVVDTLPPGATVMGEATDHGIVGGSGNQRVFNLASLTNGEVATMYLLVTFTNAGTFTNSAVASSSVTDTNTANSTDTEVTTVTPPPPSTVQMARITHSVSEGQTAQVELTRQGSLAGTVTVPVSVLPATAKNPDDYTSALLVEVQFNPGETQKFVPISTVDDTNAEPNETLLLVLGQPVGPASLGAPASTTVAIINNDALPVDDLFIRVSMGPFGIPIIEWNDRFALQYAFDPDGPWTTLIGAGSPFFTGDPNDLTFTFDGFLGLPTVYFRVAKITAPCMGTIVGTVRDGDGTPIPGTMVRVGDSTLVAATDGSGNFVIPNVPPGTVPLNFEKVVGLSNEITGQIEYVETQITLNVAVTCAIVPVNVQLDLPKELPKPPCNCTPTCGIVGGTFDGVQKVVAGGGKRGVCAEVPVVTVTGPGGINESLLGKRKTYSPAASGTWTVTVTICGRTKVCKITLP